MVPTEKKSPERCDLEANVTTPELSVAVGDDQVIILPPEPRGVFSFKLPGQFRITGGTSSTKNNKKIGLVGIKWRLITELILLGDLWENISLLNLLEVKIASPYNVGIIAPEASTIVSSRIVFILMF